MNLVKTIDKVMYRLGFIRKPKFKPVSITAVKSAQPIYALGSPDPVAIWRAPTGVLPQGTTPAPDFADTYDTFAGADITVKLDGKPIGCASGISWLIKKKKGGLDITGTLLHYMVAEKTLQRWGLGMSIMSGTHKLELWYWNEYGNGTVIKFDNVKFIEQRQANAVDDIVTEINYTWTASSIKREPAVQPKTQFSLTKED